MSIIAEHGSAKCTVDAGTAVQDALCNAMCDAFVGALQFVLWDLHSVQTSWVCSVYCAAAVSSVGYLG